MGFLVQGIAGDSKHDPGAGTEPLASAEIYEETTESGQGNGTRAVSL